MVEIEFHQLEQPYQALRITKISAKRKLLSSLASDGQQTPVLVVAKGIENYVLIDGYLRVAALKELGRDTVEAIVLPLNESSALILKHQQERSTSRCALEEAWMIQALMEQHGLKQQELAIRLGHSQSWVSRRFALVNSLPESVQRLVRDGRFSSYLATKYLVPMARAIKNDCENLAQNLAGHEVNTRQMERLYIEWRSSDKEGKARIIDNPLLFLKSIKELERPAPAVAESKMLLKDFDTVDAACRRIIDRIARCQKDTALSKKLIETWLGTQKSIEALVDIMNEKIDD